jgi:hypothetical protein
MSAIAAVLEPPKKKRGRKKKSEETPLTIENPAINIIMTIEENEPAPAPATMVAGGEPVLKKRGRKPKGGKLIVKPSEKADSVKPVANVILHLKCSLQDLNEHNTKIHQFVTDPLSYNPSVPPSIMSFNINESRPFSVYESESMTIAPTQQTNGVEPYKEKETDFAYKEFDSKAQILSNGSSLCTCCSTQKITGSEKQEEDDSSINVKDINTKLKRLKLELYKSSNLDKKSACFWCTYDYDNPPCYIPKYEMDGNLYGYGSFCRPECAAAFLMEEKLDDSTKFERYHLLNQIYSKIYEYKKNIKPAPNPYFLLDKFYGNLSIQEYRKLLKTEHMLLVIDKPMTRILPELHEDNEDFITNIFGGKQQTTNASGVYKVKRQSEKQKGPSKTTIMKENFGF